MDYYCVLCGEFSGFVSACECEYLEVIEDCLLAQVVRDLKVDSGEGV